MSVIMVVALANTYDEGLIDATKRRIYLKAYDLEARDGHGWFETTDDRAQALRFPDSLAAMLAWKTQSTTRPLRPDGKPNRPLTALTVSIEEA